MAVGVCASGRIGVGYARRASMDGTECDNYLHAGPEVRFLVISRSLQLFWPHTQWQGARSRRFFFNFFLRALQLSSARGAYGQTGGAGDLAGDQARARGCTGGDTRASVLSCRRDGVLCAFFVRVSLLEYRRPPARTLPVRLDASSDPAGIRKKDNRKNESLGAEQTITRDPTPQRRQ